MRNPIGEKIEDFELLEKIGSGGFAEVFKARCLQPGYEDLCVAIKRISKDYVYKKKCEQRIKTEIDIHSQLSHPSIVKFYTSLEDEEYLYLVLELCTGGSFEEFIKYRRCLSEEEAYPLIKQVIDGVQYLHFNNIIHRDLSLRNILLSDSGNAKIADFGLSGNCHPNEKKTSVLGTANFMSPEVIMHGPYNVKADCWSVGCVLYALLYGAPPFDDKKKKSIMNGAVKSDLTFPDYASNEAMDLLKDMLKKDAKERIEIKNALQYAFFQKYEKSGKKCENNSQKSGDSGMSSLSSSASLSSRSTQKIYGTSNKEMKNMYGKNNPMDSQRYYYDHSNGYIKSGNQQEDNCSRSGRQRAKSPSKPKLKKNKSVSGCVNQLKNKLQTLPSRQEIYDLVTGQACPDTAEYMKCKEKQKWNLINELHAERDTFNHDDGFESQFEVPIRSRPESPSYPPHLQNLAEENLNINSYYSCHNEIDNNKNSASIYRQNNCITRTNSQENMLKNSSCSHDQYCAHENSCVHKSSCFCRQCPALVHKSRSNSYCSHHSCEKEDQQGLETRNSTVDKSLKSILTPLTTARLSPKRYTTKNAIVSVLNNGQVSVEFLKLKGKRKYVAHVCFISHDGMMINVYKPKKKILPSDEPPLLPNSSQEVQYFTFENLPETHWKKYQLAKRFVDIVRAKTPKVTIYGKDAKCIMMENTPNPDYEMNFYNGFQITEVGRKIIVMDQNGINLTHENEWDTNTEFMLNVFASMKEECHELEAHFENLSKIYNNTGKTYFPVIVGRRPNALRNLDVSKENVTPRSMHSSLLNGAIISMQSYDDTINTDCSPCTNSSQTGIPSPLSNEKSVASACGYVNEILPSLKGQPLVVNGWVIAEYEDGIQMWISMNEQDVFFLDIHTKKRLPNDQNPELMKRFQRDLSSVLLRALSEEVKRTK